VLDRVSIRWRLALTSAGLTFVILAGFAIAIGQLTTSRIRSDFDNEMAAAASDLADRMTVAYVNGEPRIFPDLDLYAASNHAVIRVINKGTGIEVAGTKRAPNLDAALQYRTARYHGYRIEARETILRPGGTGKDALGLPVIVQYARRVSDVDNTVSRVRIFLLLGVLGGTSLALGAGLLLARRAMRPIADLTAVAQEIATTRDPGKSMPRPKTDDEVAQLADTLQAMLDSLEASQDETEQTLSRQRQFVADASHELRTPLTSILANLELLAEVLDGERGEAARSALRSSQRMRRLVGDLLLLARADAKRHQPREPTDVGQVLVEAAAELGPMADGHEMSIDIEEGVVDGARDELHRLALNLMENALRHTPDGTHVRAEVTARDGEVVLTVEDDGPGVPPELHERVFERFVRGSGDRGSSSGLGLSIVRAVAESHGGSVTLEDAGPGARFVVRLPRAETTARTPALPA
jgi:two-component system, OmpR family, sensor kinase